MSGEQIKMLKMGRELRKHLRWMRTEKFSPQHIEILLGTIRGAFPAETLEWIVIAADGNRSNAINSRMRDRG